LGIIVALSAYLFLYVINPDLTVIKFSLITVESDPFSLSEEEQTAPTSTVTSTATGTGNVPQLYQCSSDLASLDYSKNGQCKEKSGKTSTICSSGCGVVATTMVLKYYGKDASVKDVAQKVTSNGGRVCNSGSSPAGLAAAAESYGLKSQSTSAETALSKAGKDKPVVISVGGANSCGKSCRFTKNSHYIVVTSRDGDNLTINDSANSKGLSSRQQITVSQLSSECCLRNGVVFN